MNRKLLTLLLSIWVYSVSAQHYLQHPELNTDTTYNVNREFRKHKKKYPDIKPAQAISGPDLRIDSNLVYRQIGDRALHLDLIRPAKGKKLPVVIMVHGGGWRSGDKNMHHPMAYHLARKGYAAVTIEYRLSTEAAYPASLTDLKVAIRWVRSVAKKYKLDPKHIALLGCSSGGQMVSLIGSINGTFEAYEPHELDKYSDKVNAVVDIDGVLAFIHPDSGEGADKPDKPSAATLWFGKPLASDSASRIEASALTHLGPQSAAFLVMCSAQERFHAGYKELIEKLKSEKIEASSYQIPNTPHTFWLFHPWFDEMMTQIELFLQKQLKE